MFKITRKDKRSPVEKEIERLLATMATYSPDSKEYATLVGDLGRLCEANGKNPKRRISPDTMALIIANLAGIVLVLGYEHAHIIVSKALGFIIKGRV